MKIPRYIAAYKNNPKKRGQIEAAAFAENSL
jgi:hypothetical protein